MPNPPKHDPVRKRGTGSVSLPAEGRKGRPPKWPLGECEDGEAAAWTELWRTPQSVMWERLGWTRTVARYCRLMVRAESPKATPALLAQATALEDRLGLTPKSMRLLLWTITPNEVEEKRQEQNATSARGRIKAV